jgi:hypothetical protein
LKSGPAVVATLLIAACAPTGTGSTTTAATPGNSTTSAAPVTTSSAASAPTTDAIPTGPGLLAAGLDDAPLAVPAEDGGAFSPSYLIPVGLVDDDRTYLAIMGYDDDPAQRGMTLWVEEGGTWSKLPEPLFTDLGLGLEPPGPIATSLVETADGSWLAFGWGSPAGEPDTSSIWGATSFDLAGPWEAISDQVLEPGPAGSWDDGGVNSPSVIRTEDGYMMLYDGWSAEPGDQVGLATSSDGLTWTREPEPVMAPGADGAFDARSIQIPRLALTPDGWFMAYMGLEADIQQPGRVGLATSHDLTSWSKLGIGLQPSDVPSDLGVHTIAFDFRDGELSLLAEVLGETRSEVWRATAAPSDLLQAG